MEKLKKLYDILEKYFNRKFYGNTLIKWQAGIPVKIEKEREDIII